MRYVCGSRFHATYNRRARKHIMLMRLAVLYQPKHAVELDTCPSKPQSGSRFRLDTRPP